MGAGAGTVNAGLKAGSSGSDFPVFLPCPLESWGGGGGCAGAQTTAAVRNSVHLPFLEAWGRGPLFARCSFV